MADVAQKSDLAVRTASAIVMLAVAGTALWTGGAVFQFFVALVAFLVVLEWRGIVVRFPDSEMAKGIWMAIGGLYVAMGCAMILLLDGRGLILPLLGAVIGTDIGAYFAGRLIGGPKIAPAISPSKTWAGLGGGMAGASVALSLALAFLGRSDANGWIVAMRDQYGALTLLGFTILTGCLLAIAAQAGDFFESWMKRRAGVKDSGALIPGHGGMFDRVDGLLAAAPVYFLVMRMIMA